MDPLVLRGGGRYPSNIPSVLLCGCRNMSRMNRPHLSSSLAIFEGRTVRPKAIVRPRISPTPVYEKSRKSPPPHSEIAERLSVQAISRRFATARAFDRASLTFSMCFFLTLSPWMLEAAIPQILLIWWSYVEKVIQMRFEIRVAIVHIFGMPWADLKTAAVVSGVFDRIRSRRDDLQLEFRWKNKEI